MIHDGVRLIKQHFSEKSACVSSQRSDELHLLLCFRGLIASFVKNRIAEVFSAVMQVGYPHVKVKHP